MSVVFSIGSFSLMSGLSITPLRHHDEVGLYATLRGLRVPVEAMRSVRERGVDAVLAEHRDRLRAQADGLAGLLTTVEHYLDTGIPMKTSRITQVTILAEDLTAAIAFYREHSTRLTTRRSVPSSSGPTPTTTSSY